MFTSIRKYFKKRKLLRKYKMTNDKMMVDLLILGVLEGKPELQREYIHKRMCKLRCYNRLKAL
jgi:hypothetical protein